MCGGHLLEFHNCHIHVKEGGEMTVNLPHKEKERNIKYNQIYRKMKENEKTNIRKSTSWKKSSPLSLWATKMNFSKF